MEGHILAKRKEAECCDLKDESFIIMQPKARFRDEMEEMLWNYEKGGFLPQVIAVEQKPSISK